MGLSQGRAPIFEALEEFKRMRVVPFDVPGHKRGRGNPELCAFLGERCLSVDVNSMKPLDNLCHPTGVIRDAERLAAQAFGAAEAFFMVGGTTSAVQAMILSICRRGDEIILPRNIHRSVMGALILCGAHPVYINPKVSRDLGIALGVSLSDIQAAIDAHPAAKAVLINNPTYYGVCSDVNAITALAHRHGMKVLADEAHGTHFYFGGASGGTSGGTSGGAFGGTSGGALPVGAIRACADMASVSMHKSGGSLTQSSFLLSSHTVNAGHVRQIVNLTQTTSSSYLLLSSLDLSRRYLVQNGARIFQKVVDMAGYARREINRIGGYYAFADELIDGDAVFDFDLTKLSINTLGIGLAGIEVYDLLRDEYDIQIEFGDIGNILAYLSVGDTDKNIERLIGALAEIRRRYKRDQAGLWVREYIDPEVVVSPQEAFYDEKRSVPLAQALGEVSSEFVMCYPPGIPILGPGERVTREILDYIRYAKEKGCSLTGSEDMDVERLNVMK